MGPRVCKEPPAVLSPHETISYPWRLPELSLPNMISKKAQARNFAAALPTVTATSPDAVTLFHPI